MKNKKVFFIEDEEEIIDLYSLQLTRGGFEVESFKTGNEALARINAIGQGQAEPPQVIILDLLLPDVSGLAILGELRNKFVFDNTLIIVFTNYASENLRTSLRQMKNVEYLSKADTTPGELYEIIERKSIRS